MKIENSKEITKIGKLKTVNSLIEYEYEVIRIDDDYYAGVDAFSYPANMNDLRSLSCLVIPQQWEWTQQYVAIELDGGPLRGDGDKNKYNVVKSAKAYEAFQKMMCRQETGVLSMMDGDYPYGIPINHILVGDIVYMHCGKKGKKLFLMNCNPKVCYTVHGKVSDLPPNVRSCHLDYDSVVITGVIRVVEDGEEKQQAVKAITQHYGTPFEHGSPERIVVLALDIEKVTARDGRFNPKFKNTLYYYKPSAPEKLSL